MENCKKNKGIFKKVSKNERDFMDKLIEKLKNNKEKIYDKLVFIIEAVLSGLLGINIYKILYLKEDFGYISKLHLAFAIILVGIIIAIFVLNYKKYKSKIEKLFVTFIIPIGMMFVILLPPTFTPDEEGHIFKCYDLSMGHLVTPLGEKNEGDIYVPKQLYDITVEKNTFTYSKIHSLLSQDANYEETVPAQTAAKSYSPVSYIVGGITFAICRVLDVNLMLACFIIKLLNFILFVIIGYIIIKIVPFGKLVFAIYMFLPMCITQAASISADSFINNICLLFIAYNLKLLFQKHDLKLSQRILYYVMAILVSLCKYVYFPLVFLSLLLFGNKEIKKRKVWEIVIVSIILALICAVGWYIYSGNYVDVRVYIKEANVNSSEQLKQILSSPLNYLEVLKNTIYEYGGDYLLTFGGTLLRICK